MECVKLTQLDILSIHQFECQKGTKFSLNCKINDSFAADNYNFRHKI